MKKNSNLHVLFDIDNTLTRDRPGAMDHLLFGNFLFPLIADFALRKGFRRTEVESEMEALLQTKNEWDYPDFLALFSISLSDILPEFRQWHRKNLDVLDDSVRLVRKLLALEVPVSIISNNPRLGCLLKLERCGLADAGKNQSVFQKILSTEIMKGCKHVPGAWNRALRALNLPPDRRILMVGDHPVEDGELPLLAGVSDAFLLNRSGKLRPGENPALHIFENADLLSENL